MTDERQTEKANSGETASLGELAFLFLRLGTVAFGGPAAHIAMMEEEIVRRRGWLTREKFLDLLGAANLIPGPNSTELAIHIGYERAGWPGLFVAGTCFILPAALIVTALAWSYVAFGKLPEVSGILYGVKPVIIAVVLQALWGLGKTAVKTKLLAVSGVIVLVLCFSGINELALLFGTGFVLMFVDRLKRRLEKGESALQSFFPSALLLFQSSAPATAAAFGLWPLFLFFLKVGAVLFGSGYVLLAFLRADLVERWGWLTNEQLLDAIAVGQITPGPVFTTATFIGYLLGGTSGAAAATVGIFLPAFVFVGLSGWIVPRLRRSPAMAAFLDGVNVASLALMVFVAYELGRSALIDRVTILLFLLSAVLLIRFKLNSAWLVIGGALTGSLLSLGTNSAP
ncbi:MAG: chromate efflux transporter [Acidobacteria bacterium]|nr:chromate efflux transporter [Acidobacteriota bacterium]